MLHFITDAPEMIVREAIAFVPGASVDYAWDGHGAPTWANVVIEATRPSDALQLALASLGKGGYRLDGFRPRPAIADPTFAMAAAAIDRSYGGGSSAPAAAYAL